MRKMILFLLLLLEIMGVNISVFAQTPEPIKKIINNTSSFKIYHAGAVEDELFFITNKVEIGGFSTDLSFELWKTDGTDIGTKLVKVIYQKYTYLDDTCPCNGLMFFVARDDNFSNNQYGIELWKSDGTSNGTQMVKDIYDKQSGFKDATVGRMVCHQNKLYFAINDQTNGMELWVSDGSEANTHMVKDINPNGGSIPDFLINRGDLFFFTAFKEDNLQGLYKSDGTESGTQLVKLFDQQPYGSRISQLFLMDNNIYFTVDDGTNGNELWKSDGTEEGTVMVKDLAPGSAGSYVERLTVVNKHLFFSYWTAELGYELWVTDGTDAGTRIVKDIFPGTNIYSQGNSGSPEDMTALGDKLIFTGFTSDLGREIYVSDGTAEGTFMLIDIFTGSSYSDPNSLIAFNGNVFFSANETYSSTKLWMTDGTIENTKLVEVPNPSSNLYFYEFPHIAGDNLFFKASDGQSNWELWKIGKWMNTSTDDITEFDKKVISVVPNPFNEQTIIRFDNAKNQSYTFQVFDLVGKLVFEREINNGNEFVFDRNGMNAGVYIYNVINDHEGNVFTGKLILK